MGFIFSDAKSLKIKLVLLYTAAVLSFLFTLLALIGAHPVLPWWSIFHCEGTSEQGDLSVYSDCRSVSIGLLKTKSCTDGDCSVVSNSNLDLISTTLKPQNATANTTSFDYIDNAHFKVEFTTEISDMGDVEIAGSVAFAFMLIGFVFNMFCGLACFHHLTTGKAGRKINVATFISTAVFYLTGIITYLCIMGTSDDVDEYCDEITRIVEGTVTEDSYMAEKLLDSHCIMYIGSVLALLSAINMTVGSILAWFTTNPESEELEMTDH